VSASRASAADREWVIGRLRGSCEDERISLDTFAARVDLVYAAQNRDELVDLLADLPPDHALARVVLNTVTWLSWWVARLQAAWRQPRTPRLILPLEENVIIGRSRDCACVLDDPTISRRHAVLDHVDGAWWLRDLGSINGTYVNGFRIMDQLEVRAGDEVAFGAATYQLALAPTRLSHTRQVGAAESLCRALATKRQIPTTRA